MRNKRLIIFFSILLTITMLVLTGSIVFSVKTINTYCVNDADANAALGMNGKTLSRRIMESSGVEKGKSIFLINDEKTIKSINDSVPDARVTKIVRHFPSRLTIKYERRYEYYEVASGGKYYGVTEDGRVISKVDAATSDKIEVRANYTGEYEVNDSIFNAADSVIYTKTVNIFLGIHDNDRQAVLAQVEFIDVTKGTEQFPQVFVGLRNTGVRLQIHGLDDFAYKLHLAMTVFYDSAKFDIATDKTISVMGNQAEVYTEDLYR